MMVALSSRSAWSISALSLTLIFKLSLNKGPGLRWRSIKNLIKANKVVVNDTLPSLSIGMFILQHNQGQSLKFFERFGFSTWSAFCKPSCLGTSCQSQEEGRCSSTAPLPPCSELCSWHIISMGRIGEDNEEGNVVKMLTFHSGQSRPRPWWTRPSGGSQGWKSLWWRSSWFWSPQSSSFWSLQSSWSRSLWMWRWGTVFGSKLPIFGQYSKKSTNEFCLRCPPKLWRKGFSEFEFEGTFYKHAVEVQNMTIYAIWYKICHLILYLVMTSTVFVLTIQIERRQCYLGLPAARGSDA